jgi:hypothetical protein
MEADFEVQVGGGAPVIDALWEGFVDLRRSPERVYEISEAAVFPALAQALLALNDIDAPLWTAKCDVWDPHAAALQEPEPGLSASPEPHHAALACYIDLLPRSSVVFASWKDAENFCRKWVARLDEEEPVGPTHNATLDLIVRQALAGDREGFGITAYLGVVADYRAGAEEALAAALKLFVAACPSHPAG